MARYRAAWWRGVVLLSALGTWGAVVQLSLGGVLTILVLAACVGVSVALVPQSDGSARPWRSALRVGAVTGGVVVASAGLMGMFGTWGALIALSMTLFCPPLLTLATRWYHAIELTVVDEAARPKGPAGVPPPGTPGPGGHRPGLPDGEGATAVQGGSSPSPDGAWIAGEPESMDDVGLCLAWRKTYVALQRSWAPEWQLRITQRREQLLDELERRNARGVAAWLAAGPSASGDPSRYILTGSQSTRRDRRR